MSDYNIDDSDVSLALWSGGGGGGGGCFGVILSVIFVLVLVYFAHQNEEDCSKRSCPEGQSPKIVSHDCICVNKAKVTP